MHGRECSSENTNCDGCPFLGGKKFTLGEVQYHCIIKSKWVKNSNGCVGGIAWCSRCNRSAQVCYLGDTMFCRDCNSPLPSP